MSSLPIPVDDPLIHEAAKLAKVGKDHLRLITSRSILSTEFRRQLRILLSRNSAVKSNPTNDKIQSRTNTELYKMQNGTNYKTTDVIHCNTTVYNSSIK